MTKEQMLERQRELRTALNLLAEKEQTGRLSKAEQERVQEICDELDELNVDLKRAMRQHVLDAASGPGGSTEAGTDNRTQADNDAAVRGYQAPQRFATDHDGGQFRGEALRTVEGARMPDEVTETVVRLVERDGEDSYSVARWARAAADPAYAAAFRKLIANPVTGAHEFTEPERAAYARAQHEARTSLGVGNTGGVMVPAHLDPAVILTSAGSINPLREFARIEQIATDVWHGVASSGVVASYGAEFSQVGDNTPTLSGPTVATQKYHAWVQWSIEFGGDALGFDQQIRDLFADAVDQLQAEMFFRGAAASNQPVGVITALDGTASEIAPTTPETFADADVYKLQQALPPRYQANAAWFASLGTLNTMDQFETSNGAKLFPELGAGTLLRKPVREWSNVDPVTAINPSATADNFVLLYGDWRNYVIVDRVGTQIELAPLVFGADRRPTGERGYYLWGRNGADSVNDNGLRVLSIPTTA